MDDEAVDQAVIEGALEGLAEAGRELIAARPLVAPVTLAGDEVALLAMVPGHVLEALAERPLEAQVVLRGGEPALLLAEPGGRPLLDLPLPAAEAEQRVQARRLADQPSALRLVIGDPEGRYDERRLALSERGRERIRGALDAGGADASADELVEALSRMGAAGALLADGGDGRPLVLARRAGAPAGGAAPRLAVRVDEGRVRLAVEHGGAPDDLGIDLADPAHGLGARSAARDGRIDVVVTGADGGLVLRDELELPPAARAAILDRNPPGPALGPGA
ncbi:hypothetical protein [Miltoncostaea marina]|uniref:hypothetical protein n=1 Tax=Miltoncostaea marina TaxID=2843215 RepID=UPI001C3D761E|nr:hypothetical protein [Miltoncostaea marina]